MVRNVILAVAAAVLAAGCMSGARNADPGYRPGSNGLLVASLTASGHSPPGRLSYLVVRAEQPAQTVAAIPLNDEALALDWQLGDYAVHNNGYGRLAVVELPPGHYELRRGFIYVSAQEAYASARVLGYRFEILPGKATYLGNVHVDIEISAARRIHADTSLRDRRSRDLPLLHRKYAGVRPEHLVFPGEVDREKLLQRTADEAPLKLEDLERLLPQK